MIIHALVGGVSRLVDQAVSGGYVLAIALVCLLQYVVYLYRMGQAKRQYGQFRDELEGLESELTNVQKDRAVAVLENSILRDFVSQTELDKSLDLLLRRYVPNPREGFAVFLQRDGERFTVLRSRGLSEESELRLSADDSVCRKAAKERLHVVDGAALTDSGLVSLLSNEDRGKARQVYLVAIGDERDFFGLLLTTTLYPSSASREQQHELARRLMASVSANLKRSLTLAMQENQLRSTSEMLELRGITDRQDEAPARMFDAFVNCLRLKLDMERGSLHLTSPEGDGGTRLVARTGAPIPTHLVASWQEHEGTIVGMARGHDEPLVVGKRELARLGIETLVGFSVVIPLVSGRKGHLGTLCLTRQSAEPPTAAQIRLADWAGEHLAETISRVLAHAAVERQARQDGLTELANRRTFDHLIDVEVAAAERSGSECTLLLLDLDRFKEVNDTYGHPAGDEVLRVTSRIVRDQMGRMRSGDRAVAARYGGEELAVLLPGIGTTGALRIGEAIREAVESSEVRFESHSIRATISVGLATYPQHARSVTELVSAADDCLYQAKQQGRNRIVAARSDATSPSLAPLEALTASR